MSTSSMSGHLDFAVQACRPWQIGDIDRLERVQRKMVTALSVLYGRTYEERLVEIGMESLESRREWLDMVQTYKIVKEVDNVDRTHGFTMRGEEGSYGTRATQEGFKHHWKEVQTGGEKELLQSACGGQLEWSVCRD